MVLFSILSMINYIIKMEFKMEIKVDFKEIDFLNIIDYLRKKLD